MSDRARFFAQLLCLVLMVALFYWGARLEHLAPFADEGPVARSTAT